MPGHPLWGQGQALWRTGAHPWGAGGWPMRRSPVFEGELSLHQESAIVALINETSVAGAARASGVGERTLHKWMAEDRRFMSAYRAARRHAFDQAIALTQRYASLAVTTMAKVMADPNAAHRQGLGGDGDAAVRPRVDRDGRPRGPRRGAGGRAGRRARAGGRVTAARVKRALATLERRAGGCAACGGGGRLVVVIGGGPAPKGCRRCGRMRAIRLVGVTEEGFRAEQEHGKAGSAA